MVREFRLPVQSSASVTASPSLKLNSVLGELSLHHCQAHLQSTAQDIARRFDADPMIPGVVLVEHHQFMGMISRRRFLERMSRPYALELFLQRSIQTLYRFIAHEFLVLPSETLIVDAVQQSLQRSPEDLYEPIVVQIGDDYRLLDIHQLLLAHSRIHELAKQVIHEQTQAQMFQHEKLASLGRLIANVSHEILNPVNFIAGNINYLGNYGQDLLALIDVYDADADRADASAAMKQEIEFDFLKKDFAEIISSMRVGADRLRKIAESLRTFSYQHKDEYQATDIHECLENTLVILSTRLRHSVTVVRQYGDLPMVSVYPGQLNQVFMNLISNAADAIAERQQQPSRVESDRSLSGVDWQPQITITTRQLTREELLHAGDSDADRWICISIDDNGCGIPDDIQERIFDEFFTTKPVEHGTGLGLAICRQIVLEKHGGWLHLRSQVGVGTGFDIFLPMHD
ncbi:MAG: ATP-binding protein [Leptolyngbya sp. DLM2.Bin15]|nr:MAG: ATP-binding protein [Leptolyngbya sp. DLM2.Bin15]